MRKFDEHTTNFVELPKSKEKANGTANVAAVRLFSEVKNLIEQSRRNVAITVNAEMTMLYWQIGERINNGILNNERGVYGQQVIKNLSKKLSEQYGHGWSYRQLWNCVSFAKVFPDFQIVHTLCTLLTWSHIRLIMNIEDALKREFYIEMCKIEHWSVRQLSERINSMLFERTAISRKPEKTIENDLNLLKKQQTLTPDMVFRDPYFLDFLDLHNHYSETDLENAIIAELQQFITELGSDFAFLARQKRISIDNEDYYIDLLFYHRQLRCLVAIDLKIGKFEAAYKGQMELYLRWLEKYEMYNDENPPIGLILCSGKNEEHVELLQLDKSNIKVADYLTQLPDKKILLEKLRRAIAIAQQKALTEKDENNKFDN
jgi:predicted nuclease of restriction endonuclease-like (RecB) superfamily